MKNGSVNSRDEEESDSRDPEEARSPDSVKGSAMTEGQGDTTGLFSSFCLFNDSDAILWN